MTGTWANTDRLTRLLERDFEGFAGLRRQQGLPGQPATGAITFSGLAFAGLALTLTGLQKVQAELWWQSAAGQAGLVLAKRKCSTTTEQESQTAEALLLLFLLCYTRFEGQNCCFSLLNCNCSCAEAHYCCCYFFAHFSSCGLTDEKDAVAVRSTPTELSCLRA